MQAGRKRIAARVGRAINTDHKEEVQNVGQGQGGQAKQPQQGRYSCQPIPAELWHVKRQEAYHNTCNKPLIDSAKQILQKRYHFDDI